MRAEVVRDGGVGAQDHHHNVEQRVVVARETRVVIRLDGLRHHPNRPRPEPEPGSGCA